MKNGETIIRYQTHLEMTDSIECGSNPNSKLLRTSKRSINYRLIWLIWVEVYRVARKVNNSKSTWHQSVMKPANEIRFLKKQAL